MSYSY